MHQTVLIKLTKDDLQDYGLTKYLTVPGNILYEFSMGTGKTKLALEIARRSLHYGPLVLVSNSVPAITKTWPAEIEKHGYLDIADKLQSYHYGNCKKHVGDIGLLILDEYHLIRQSAAALAKRAKRVILLSGTHPDNVDKRKLVNEIVPFGNRYKFSLEDSIQHNLVNPYQIRVAVIPRDVDGAWTSKYLWLCREISNKGSDYAASQSLRLARMHHIYNHPNKVLAAKFIMDMYRKKNRRFITFVPYKEHAKALSNYIQISGEGGKHQYLDHFINKYCNELVTVDQIREGANIPDLLYALVNQINGSGSDFLQKLGRLLRYHDKTAVGTIWITIVDSTYDVVWLNKNLKNLNNKVVTYHTIPQETLNTFINL